MASKINWFLPFCIGMSLFTIAGCATNSTKQQMTGEELQKYWQEPEQSAHILVDKMDNRARIGQILMLDFRNWGVDEQGNPKSMTVLPERLAEVVGKYALGSVVLFRENLLNTEQTYQLINDIQRARKGLPLFVAVDQEGGYVTRLREGTELPGNMALAATRDKQLAYQSGQVHGAELNALGFNINFAPVVDVNVNQKNPIIGVRSYSSKIALVNEMANAYIEGLHSQHMLSSIKHFPGHGNVEVDSHVGLPTVPYSEQEWRNVDLVPFKEAIKKNVDSIMTAHVLVPALDDTTVISKKDNQPIHLPATLSKKIITGILRDELNYDGLVMTDAMDMGAIAENFGPFEAVEMAILAGVDIPLMPIHPWSEKGIQQLEQLYDFLEKRMQENPQLKQRIDESALRVVKTKLAKKIDVNTMPVEQAKQIVAKPAHKMFERRAAEKAITLIRNDQVLPYKLNKQNRILLIADENARNDIIRSELMLLDEQYPQVSISVDSLAFELQKSSIPAALEHKIKQSDLVILTTYNLVSSPIAAQHVINLAANNKKPLVVIASRNPYDIAYLKQVKANIAIYGVTGFDITNANRNSLEANIRAGIRTLFALQDGVNLKWLNTPQGKLPVDIYSENGTKILYPFGRGLSYK